MTHNFDIAVIGAGPAGAWAARRLAQAGAQVAIFDASHPREKPCGGGITSRALELLTQAPQVPRVRPVQAVFEGSDRVARVPLRVDGCSPGSSMIVASRRDFDRALLDAARDTGAEHIAERVAGVAVHSGGVRISTTSRAYDARFVVGADGANSLVRRRLSTPFTRAQLSLAAGVFVHDTTDMAIVIRCVADPPGYIWSFPRADHLAIGICAQADVSGSAALKAHAARWLESTDSVPAGARRAPQTVYSWPIPSLAPRDFAAQRVAGDRWLLVGDAAGLVDPITREGIYFALESAGHAANALLDGSRGTAAARYERALRAHIYPELRRAAMLKRRFFTRGFTSLMVEALAHSARIRQVMADLIEGRQPYVGLGRRLLRTGELGLAWRLLRTGL